MSIGIYPGTFDPITYGHLDLIRRSFKVVDSLIVAISRSTWKTPVFSIEERIEMISESVNPDMPVTVEAFEGLLVDYVARKNASVIIRGLRALSDFEYEFQMALMNKQLNKEIEVIFMVPDVSFTFLSSTIVKEVVELGGDVSDLVPEPVLKRLKKKYPGV